MSTPLALARPPGDERAPAQCLNCGAALTGPFCAQCGQRDHALNVSLWHLLAEFAEDYFHFDSKLPLTLGTLIARPGKLTCEFTAGHRVKYVGPFKLYVLCSVLFFLVTALVPKVHGAPTLNADHVKVDFDHLGQQDPLFVRLAAKRLKTRYDGETAQQMARHVSNALSRYMPDAMLALVPLFALLLKLLWRRRFYAEHFVTALHLHALGYLVMAVLALHLFAVLNLVFFFAGLGHLIVSLRRIYGQGWLRTTLKAGFAIATYTFTIAATLLAVVIGGLMFG